MQENLRKPLAAFDAEFLVQTAFAEVCVDEQNFFAEACVKCCQVDGNEALAYAWNEAADADNRA